MPSLIRRIVGAIAQPVSAMTTRSPMSTASISDDSETLQRYVSRYPEDAPVLQAFSAQLLDDANVLDRSNMRGHVTTSALVLNAALTHGLVIHHRVFRRLAPRARTTRALSECEAAPIGRQSGEPRQSLRSGGIGGRSLKYWGAVRSAYWSNCASTTVAGSTAFAMRLSATSIGIAFLR